MGCLFELNTHVLVENEGRFLKKQARKGFRPPSAMKGIGYFQNLRNLLRNFLEIFWILFWEFFGRIFWEDFLEEFIWKIVLEKFVLGRIFWGGYFWEEFFERNSLRGIT